MKKCVGHRISDGQPCGRPPTHGATVCTSHGGSAPQVKRSALVRAEVAQWVLGDATDDPGTVLLRLITQSRRRADLYASLLEEAYEAAEVLGSTDWSLPKGVAALIGHKHALDAQGNPVAIAEAIRGLVVLEAQERDRCVNFCTKAITAGLAERVVRMQEREASQAHEALMAGLDAAGITGALRAKVLDGTVAHLRLVGKDES